MSLTLVVNKNTLDLRKCGKRYRKDIEILKTKEKYDIEMLVEELIETEKILTLLEEKENKKKENLVYNKFIEALRLKRKSKYGY